MDYHETCAALIKQINDALEKQANNTLREDDLTMMQVAVLIELDGAEGGTLSMKELEHKFGVAQPTMVGIVKRLQQKGMVDSMTSRSDRRVKLVCLTREGTQKCKRGYLHMENAEDGLLSALDAAEREQFRLMLEKVRASLK